MIETRPDWVLSRQRTWGVPISLFINKQTGFFIPNKEFDKSEILIDRIHKIFSEEGQILGLRKMQKKFLRRDC
ncbi:MAG: hypothetical protein CM15mP73_5070 [Hyphomicrobiales bacterium]|nr:MAG: hypothetical protein CM15mP73_5070 [Hyphomicrobiales bacterium]